MACIHVNVFPNFVIGSAHCDGYAILSLSIHLELPGVSAMASSKANRNEWSHNLTYIFHRQRVKIIIIMATRMPKLANLLRNFR